MSKSPAVIAAIGISGCLALSLVMREFLEVQHELERDPIALELEARFPRRLIRPVRVSSQEKEGRLVVYVDLKVIAGLRKDRFVGPAGRVAWDLRLGDENEPDEVIVRVTDDGEGKTLTAIAPRPR